MSSSAFPTTTVDLYRPHFPPSWTPCPLYDLASWTNGTSFKSSGLESSGTPVIKIAEVKNGVTNQTKYSTEPADGKVTVTAGDLIYSWSGQPETSIDAFRWEGVGGYLNQHLFKVRAGRVTQEFLYYLLKHLRPHLVSIARNKQTTGLGHVTKGDLKRLEVAYPDDNEQARIVDVLKALDDKIALNRRMNRTLESIARTLFQSWFVDFDPVHARASGSPGSSTELAPHFPGAFEPSPLGDIPEGWNVRRLSDIADILSGGTPRKSNPSFWNGQLPWVSPKSMSSIHVSDTEQHVTEEAVGSGTKEVAAGASFIMVRGMGLHDGVRISQARCRSTFNQDVKAIVPREIDPALLLFVLLDAQTSLHKRVRSSGHGTGVLPTDAIGELQVALPPTNVADLLIRPFGDMNERIAANDAESRTLAALRDTLLPKLMGGELDGSQVGSDS